MLRVLIYIVTLFWASLAAALGPGEILDDPVLESRARSISAELRCLVCQNQSIDDSDAELARDLRLIVRERLTAGDSDQQVLDHVVARYGEFVLLRPVLGPHTIILWIAAPMLLLLGVLALVVARRKDRTRSTASEEMSQEERAALERLTKI